MNLKWKCSMLFNLPELGYFDYSSTSLFHTHAKLWLSGKSVGTATNNTVSNPAGDSNCQSSREFKLSAGIWLIC